MQCCDQTFKQTLEEVITMIKANKPPTVEDVVKTLEYAISLLDKKEKLEKEGE